MSLEIRPLFNYDEVLTASSVMAHAFGSASRHEDGAEQLESIKERFEPDWYLGAFDDGEMTAMMRIVPNEMYINGAALTFGAVSPVASSPLHRRKGHTGQMLRRSIEIMRDRGQMLSGLYTPHPAFYRRYGWEIASEERKYTFKPKDLSVKVAPTQRGSFHALRPDDWRQLEPVHRANAAIGNGPFVRDESWWKGYILDARWRGVHDIVLWKDDSGNSQGYAVYTLPVTGEDANKVVVLELVALTGDARLNLLSFFGRYDLHNEVVLFAPPHDTLPLLFSDTERVSVTQGFAVMLRICDFEAAMRARPAARADDTDEVTLRLEDASAPWNGGTWRVGIAEGRTQVERTDGEAELTLDERTIAPLYNGYITPSTAFASGLLRATSKDALERAGRVFAVRQPPYFYDHF